MAPRPLPRAPSDVLGPDGPRLGRYAGWLGRADLAALTPPGLLASLRHALRERRWQRATLAGADHLAVVEIAAGGALASGLLWVAERDGGRVALDRAAAGLPGVSGRVGDRPGAGARASFSATGLDLLLERRSDRFQLTATAGEVRLAATLDTRGAPEPQALVAALSDGGLRATQVSGPLALGGWLEVGGLRRSLEGGAAALEFTSGVFPAAVAWRRLAAVSPAGEPPRCLHLVSEPPDAVASGAGADPVGESVLLGPGGPRPLPPLTLESPEGWDWRAPWRAVSADGAVDLAFRPQAIHRESKELLARSSRRVILLGVLSGRMPSADGEGLLVRDWPAVAEDFQARG
jgi:hypothetical protein